MNRDNINNVIAWLNKGAPEFVFSMRYALIPLEETDLAERDEAEDGFYSLAHSQRKKVETSSCGSVCCIAGAAAQFDGMSPHDISNWEHIQKQALAYFGVETIPRMPWMLPVFDPDFAPAKCGPRTAANALKI